MKKLLLLLILSAVLLLPFRVSAQEEHAAAGEGEAAEHVEESPWAVVFRWTNFILLFGGLGYLLRKPAQEFFETRKNDITAGLERAQRAQVEAQARMGEIEQRLGRLSSDVAALRADAERESKADEQKILADAKREVERVVDQSNQEIARVARSIEREIKENVADRVVERASKTLRTEMTQDDQKRVVVRFIKNL